MLGSFSLKVVDQEDVISPRLSPQSTCTELTQLLCEDLLHDDDAPNGKEGEDAEDWRINEAWDLLKVRLEGHGYAVFSRGGPYNHFCVHGFFCVL